MSVSMEVTVTGSAAGLDRFRKGIESPAGMKRLHQRIAREARDFTRAFVAADASHATARKLGAKPTGHMAKTARRIEGEGETHRAVLKIPRKSRLRAAFGEFTIRPLPPHKWLARPDHPLTYGKMPSSFPPDTFNFVVLAAHRMFPVLMFANGAEKGKVAYWLQRETKVKEDRTLLPWEELPQVAARVASAYVADMVKGGSSA